MLSISFHDQHQDRHALTPIFTLLFQQTAAHFFFFFFFFSFSLFFLPTCRRTADWDATILAPVPKRARPSRLAPCYPIASYVESIASSSIAAENSQQQGGIVQKHGVSLHSPLALPLGHLNRHYQMPFTYSSRYNPTLWLKEQNDVNDSSPEMNLRNASFLVLPTSGVDDAPSFQPHRMPEFIPNDQYTQRPRDLSRYIDSSDGMSKQNNNLSSNGSSWARGFQNDDYYEEDPSDIDCSSEDSPQRTVSCPPAIQIKTTTTTTTTTTSRSMRDDCKDRNHLFVPQWLQSSYSPVIELPPITIAKPWNITRGAPTSFEHVDMRYIPETSGGSSGWVAHPFPPPPADDVEYAADFLHRINLRTACIIPRIFCK
jgi:hypothetical protein